MVRRYPARYRHLPTLWLMTDERQGDALWPALAALPRGSGVVFRHHHTAATARAALLAKVAHVARRRGLTLWMERLTPSLRLVRYGSTDTSEWIARVHDGRAGVAARLSGAAAVFVSPVFPTRTHPGRSELGPLRAAAIVRASRLSAIALGGMTPHRFRQMKRLGFHGWAAIDGLTP